MSKEKNGESRKKQAKKTLEMPSIDLLEGELKQTQYKTRYGRVLRSTIFSLLVVAAVAVIIAVLLMPVLQISGNSMEDTLSDGDLVIALNNGKFKTGEVIGFYFNNGILVKRVIEPYISEKALGECNITLPYQVPDGKCFVMGDHRANSIDSRTTTVGCISGDKIVGKLLLRFWPLRSFGLIR